MVPIIDFWESFNEGNYLTLEQWLIWETGNYVTEKRILSIIEKFDGPFLNPLLIEFNRNNWIWIIVSFNFSVKRVLCFFNFHAATPQLPSFLILSKKFPEQKITSVRSSFNISRLNILKEERTAGIQGRQYSRSPPPFWTKRFF